MAKPESWRLNPASYPVSLESQTRFQDLDVNQHLNNVAYAVLFENARVQLHLGAKLAKGREPGEHTLVAAVEISYLAEGHFPAPVTVCSGIEKIGDSSWTIVQAIFQNSQCIATSSSVIANRRNGAACPVRPELYASLESHIVKPA